MPNNTEKIDLVPIWYNGNNINNLTDLENGQLIFQSDDNETVKDIHLFIDNKLITFSKYFHEHDIATEEDNGFMSTEDKKNMSLLIKEITTDYSGEIEKINESINDINDKLKSDEETLNKLTTSLTDEVIADLLSIRDRLYDKFDKLDELLTKNDDTYIKDLLSNFVNHTHKT